MPAVDIKQPRDTSTLNIFLSQAETLYVTSWTVFPLCWQSLHVMMLARNADEYEIEGRTREELWSTENTPQLLWDTSFTIR